MVLFCQYYHYFIVKQASSSEINLSNSSFLNAITNANLFISNRTVPIYT